MVPDLKRRDVVKLGAMTAAATAVACSATNGSRIDSPSPTRPPGHLRTRLCDLLGIQHPVLQAPMARVASPALVAAVSEAGGLGILPGVGVPPPVLREQIREIHARTKRPFAVNLLLHEQFIAPADPAKLLRATIDGAQGMLNRFRGELKLPPRHDPPPPLPDLIGSAFAVILEERVPVFSIGLGRPTSQQMERCRAQGMKVIAMAATLADARVLAEAGVDAVIAQGGEAGGHRSTWVKPPSIEHAAIGAMVLVPQLAQALGIPVVAAGGIGTGRQLAAALALGATGVHMGTRFIATQESIAPAFHKQAVLASDGDGTRLTDAFTGLYARVLRNRFSEEYAASGAPVLPPLLQQMAAMDVTAASEAQGRSDFYPMYAGQGTGLLRELPAAGDVVRSIVNEALATIVNLPVATGLRE
jgi:nitronate monooxygenase